MDVGISVVCGFVSALLDSVSYMLENVLSNKRNVVSVLPGGAGGRKYDLVDTDGVACIEKQRGRLGVFVVQCGKIKPLGEFGVLVAPSDLLHCSLPLSRGGAPQPNA